MSVHFSNLYGIFKNSSYHVSKRKNICPADRKEKNRCWADPFSRLIYLCSFFTVSLSKCPCKKCIGSYTGSDPHCHHQASAPEIPVSKHLVLLHCLLSYFPQTHCLLCYRLPAMPWIRSSGFPSGPSTYSPASPSSCCFPPFCFNKCSKNSPTSSGGEMNCTSEHICSKKSL